MNTFKFGLWSISTDSKMINVLGLYHPPPLERFQHTIRQFITECIDIFATLLNSDKGTILIMCGNFNMQINDPDNNEAKQLSDALEPTYCPAVGQHVYYTYLCLYRPFRSV